ncbi:hypothetical protein AK812_SmicGene12190 [Symbiodinium microadriaticum]|uniref:Uncharacterized protein n=1 Tax=Symbiodinium microadriaticum TaxID=2951 RepID=A0A1Q9EBB5_SYMMI|nr:hypothetical protein AK812_SmicGene12190 [Symbiodinium microadriaticum]
MPNLVEPDTQFRDHFVDFRVAKTVNTIPYDASLPQKPAKDTPLGNHSSKKVMVASGEDGVDRTTGP